MKSILWQLEKYQNKADQAELSTSQIIIVEKQQHPYAEIVERLCDIPLGSSERKQIINDALLALNGFQSPPLAGVLYPLDLAVLYYLFYHHKIFLSSEKTADISLNNFIKSVVADGGIDNYMIKLKNALDDYSSRIFLFRVMLAALGARDKYVNKHDLVNHEYGIKAAQILGVAATAKIAGAGLDSSQAIASVEQKILGRIAYIAFWQWSQNKPAEDCKRYLASPKIV